MERWAGKVAIVTGASVGIGAAISKELVKHGLQVVGLARRVEKVEELSKALTDASGKLFPIKCDVSKEDEILSAFSQVKEKLGGVDILVNNAGVLYESFLSEGSTSEWRDMLEVNVLGLCLCTREAIKNMKERNQDHGHIVHINSIAGHYDPSQPGYHLYSATKHAVTALTEGLRRELVSQKSHIRVTSISPGAVDTDMFHQGVGNVLDIDQSDTPCLQPSDIAAAVIYVLGTPPRVQIHELTIKSVGEINI